MIEMKMLLVLLNASCFRLDTDPKEITHIHNSRF